MISRSGASALIPEDVSREIVQNVVYESAALANFRTVTMTRKQQNMPVLAALPFASWVNGDTGQKQLSDVSWDKKTLIAEELAIIVPIPEAVLDDSDYDLWAEVQPRMEEAIARKVDSAVFLNDTSRPSSWPAPIQLGCAAAGHSVTRGTAGTAAGGIAEDINQVMAFVEEDGFVPTAHFSRSTLRSRLRSARDTSGQRLLDVETGERGREYFIDGLPVMFGMAGLWASPTGSPELFSGDFSQGVMGIRQDMTFKFLDQAVLQNPAGTIAYNLPQQDMVAMRLVFRVAYQVPNPITYDNTDAGTRYPFGMLVKP